MRRGLDVSINSAYDNGNKSLSKGPNVPTLTVTVGLIGPVVTAVMAFWFPWSLSLFPAEKKNSQGILNILVK